MKHTIKIPTYPSELFSVRSVSVANNVLSISGIRSDEDCNIGMWHDTGEFVFTCKDAEELAGYLRIHVEDLEDYVRYMLKGHIDVLEQYCQKHGLECAVH